MFLKKWDISEAIRAAVSTNYVMGLLTPDGGVGHPVVGFQTFLFKSLAVIAVGMLE